MEKENYRLEDGVKYTGEAVDGLPHGQGTFTFPDGTKYVGEFKDDKYHGQGTFTWPDGTRYVGEFRDAKMHGQGTLTWAGGDKFVGESKEGNIWDGVYYLASGKIAGTYSNGQFCVDCKPSSENTASSSS